MNNRGLHYIFIISCAMKIFKEIMIKKSKIFTKSKLVEAKRLLELLHRKESFCRKRQLSIFSVTSIFKITSFVVEERSNRFICLGFFYTEFENRGVQESFRVVTGLDEYLMATDFHLFSLNHYATVLLYWFRVFVLGNSTYSASNYSQLADYLLFVSTMLINKW